LGDQDGLLALMVEIDVEDGGSAGVPDLLGDGEAEQDHALSGLAWRNHGLAEEWAGGEGLDLGEGGVDGFEVLLLDGAGGDLFAVGGGQGGGEVFDEEREMELVVDAESGQDVEVVFGARVGDDHGI